MGKGTVARRSQGALREHATISESLYGAIVVKLPKHARKELEVEEVLPEVALRHGC
jgi:hypothetical protein